MNSKNRRTPNRRPGQPEVRFCPRCGGTMSMSGSGNPATVCRCTQEQRSIYEGSATPAVKPATEGETVS